MAEPAETVARAAQPLPVDPEWAIGDQVLAAVASGASVSSAKLDAAKASRREPQDVTLIARVCQTFPANRRRATLLVIAKLDHVSGRDPVLQHLLAKLASRPAMLQRLVKHRVAGGFGQLNDRDVTFGYWMPTVARDSIRGCRSMPRGKYQGRSTPSG